MNSKTTFSRSDVSLISSRVSQGSNDVSSDLTSIKKGSHVISSNLARSPSSPVAAKVMREVGVSNKKISEAYSLARSTVINKK